MFKNLTDIDYFNFFLDDAIWFNWMKVLKGEKTKYVLSNYDAFCT